MIPFTILPVDGPPVCVRAVDGRILLTVANATVELTASEAGHLAGAVVHARSMAVNWVAS